MQTHAAQSTTPATRGGQLARKLPVLLWLFPDRGSARQLTEWEDKYWRRYRRVASEQDLELIRIGPDQLTFLRSTGDTRVRLNGRILDPRYTIVMADTASDPRQLPDLWPILSTLICLDCAGYKLAVPVRWSLAGADKLATQLALADKLGPLLPTMRLVAGPEADIATIADEASRLGMPLVVKPAGWFGGNGFCLANNTTALRQILNLAAGYGQPFVIQRCLTGSVVDGRSYCVDGQIVAFVERRAALPSEPANVGRGGVSTLAVAPGEAVEIARAVHEYTGLSFFCLDMLHDGRGWWFSEIEIDGAISVSGEVTEQVAERVLCARFSAYRSLLEQRNVSSDEARHEAIMH